MKILHINSYFISSNFYKNLYDRQNEDNLDISVYVPIYKSDLDFTLKFGEYTTITRNYGKYDRFFFKVKHKKIFNDVSKKYLINEYNIVHAHSLFSNGYVALMLKRSFNKPYVVAIRNTDVNIFFKYMIHLKKIGIEIVKEAEKVIFLSEAYRNLVLDRYVPQNNRQEVLNKSVIIPNGVDGFWLNNKGTSKGLINENEIRLLYVGVVDKNKNLLTTINAIKLLLQKGYKVRFTVVGKIMDYGIFKRIICHNYVCYHEPIPKEELLHIYRNNDIFVMPSKTETFGLVYPEAMSQGLPVIYTKGQGFDEQFDEGIIGYHVNSSSSHEITYRIIDIIERYNEISENCIKLCSKFNWDLINREYNDIYREIYIDE